MIAQTTQTANILADSVNRLFAEVIVDDRARASWDADLWSSLCEQGIPDALAATIDEDGQDEDRLGVQGALNLLFLAGRHAAPVPLAEHMVAAWVAALAGIPLPAGPVILAGAGWHDEVAIDPQGVVSGTAVQVALARNAQAYLAVSKDRCALVRANDVQLTTWHDTAGEPRDTVLFAATTSAYSAPLTIGLATLRASMAGARAIQMAGALEKVLELTAQYVQDRKQFGRSISKFQAVQQALAELGGQVATTKAAAELAAQAFGDPQAVAVLAAAKIRTGEAVGIASRIAHQAHGAIGFTLEYDLQRFTRRLWSWRDDYGNESVWARWLGLALTRPGAGGNGWGLWGILTNGMRSIGTEVEA